MTDLHPSTLHASPEALAARELSGLPPLPALARLKRVLDAVAQTLPGEVATLLAAPRFASGAAALARLSEPAHRDAALSSLAPAELEWLATELPRRAAFLAPLRLPPAIAILAPHQVPLGDRAERVTVQLCADGISRDWTARWHGAEAAPDGRSATLTLIPGKGADAEPVNVRVHVHARGIEDGARHALVAEATIRATPS